MNHAAAYTPLEKYCLIEWASADGIDADSLARISTDLNSSEFVNTDPDYDPSRLIPESLKRLFVCLVEEEFKLRKGSANKGPSATNDEVEAPSCPASTPPFVLDDAINDHELVFDLRSRLYQEYRQRLVDDLKELDRLDLQEEEQLREEQIKTQGWTDVPERQSKPLDFASLSLDTDQDTVNRMIQGTIVDEAALRKWKEEQERKKKGLTESRTSQENTAASLPPESRDNLTTKASRQSASPISVAAGVPAQPGASKKGPGFATPVYPPLPPAAAGKSAPVAASRPVQREESHVKPPTLSSKPLVPGPSPKLVAVGSQAATSPSQDGPPVVGPPFPLHPDAPVVTSRPRDAVSQTTPTPTPVLTPAPAPAHTPIPAPVPAPKLTSTPPLQSQVSHSPKPKSPAMPDTGSVQNEKSHQPLAARVPAQSSAVPKQASSVAAAHVAPAPAKPLQQHRTPQQVHLPVRPSASVAQPQQVSGKSGPLTPQNASQLATDPPQQVPSRPVTAVMPPKPGLQHSRPVSITPVPPPGLPQQLLPPPLPPPQSQKSHSTPRQVAAAAQQTPQKITPVPIVGSQKPTAAVTIPQASQQRPPSSTLVPSASLALPLSQKENAPPSVHGTHSIRPPVPEHVIRQTAAATLVATPGARKISSIKAAPRTPNTADPVSQTKGFGTKWASGSTPSTPRLPIVEPESPAYEPVTPPDQSLLKQPEESKLGTKEDVKPVVAATPPMPRPRGRPPGRPPKSAQKGRRVSTTPSVSGARRSQSVASQADELSLDHVPTAIRVKSEVQTPRHGEEKGDTTADESTYGRTTKTTPIGLPPRLVKRKRQDTSPASSEAPANQVLWTRGFTKVSSSALDQISSHRDANMFATGVREKNAPNYRQIVLQPQDITSIRSAIKQGNKAAIQAASNLPGGDPGTASVWLPSSDELIPPKGIINSAQLERELVHMFSNAIMYNPDPHRGPGPSFLRRNKNEEEEVVGYHVDENGVVKNTRSMFVEVEKLLGDLRSAERERGARLPPPSASATRQVSVATPADDTAEDEDELAGDGPNTTTPSVKVRRIISRS